MAPRQVGQQEMVHLHGGEETQQLDRMRLLTAGCKLELPALATPRRIAGAVAVQVGRCR